MSDPTTNKPHFATDINHEHVHSDWRYVRDARGELHAVHMRHVTRVYGADAEHAASEGYATAGMAGPIIVVCVGRGGRVFLQGTMDEWLAWTLNAGALYDCEMCTSSTRCKVEGRCLQRRRPEAGPPTLPPHGSTL